MGTEHSALGTVLMGHPKKDPPALHLPEETWPRQGEQLQLLLSPGKQKATGFAQTAIF